jgi:hypothetical protein
LIPNCLISSGEAIVISIAGRAGSFCGVLAQEIARSENTENAAHINIPRESFFIFLLNEKKADSTRGSA